MTVAQLIQDQLRAVETERATRAHEEGLDAKVRTIKEFQQRRFRHTYSDLLNSQRHGAACHFFLEELYGPRDFSQRDEQFAKVVPSLVRLFPKEIVDTVASLAELHALSERLDTEMGRHLVLPTVDAASYSKTWQATGQIAQRARQIDLTLHVARSLDLLTRRPLLRNVLRLMRPPARAAGLGELQQFLERGFDTFREMKGAQDFVATVERRERELSTALFGESLAENTEAYKASGAVSLLPPPE
ncbi:MAG: hypothetical protein Q8Q80_05310 [Methyloversatilis sp.]|uniref:FFLEELY motif protein n=1 Tax=Methyloversatilis sp. TaxID=2569862 RepID=UPI0027359937|nr:hypothetical protein [Methyloversatilis sp.]MDP3872059.1 hypothetical protein [Methyloversatilis sp.]